MRYVMTMRAFGPVFSTMGTVIVRDFNTISMGFSKMVSIAFIGLTAANVPSGDRCCSFRAALVISDSGVPKISGDADGLGVGMGGGISGVTDPSALGAILFR